MDLLPMELLYLILHPRNFTDELESGSYARLRLVDRNFAKVATPHAFYGLRLQIKPHKYMFLERLEAIAAHPEISTLIKCRFNE